MEASSPSPASPNIVLVGLMGTGKSSVARELARTLGGGFRRVDMDEEIAAEAGTTIPEIFAEEGEEGFRDRETALLQRVLEGSAQIVSTGGGVVVREENRALLNEVGGYVVWLDASLDTLAARVAAGEGRPLLSGGDPRATLERLREERAPLYEEVAQLQVDSTDLAIADVAYGIAQSAQVYFSDAGR